MQETPVPMTECLSGVAELRSHAHRNPQVEAESAHPAVEILRRDSHDRERPIPYFQHPPDDFRVAAEMAVPEAVTQDDDAVPTGVHVFARQEEPTRRRP